MGIALILNLDGISQVCWLDHNFCDAKQVECATKGALLRRYYVFAEILDYL